MSFSLFGLPTGQEDWAEIPAPCPVVQPLTAALRLLREAARSAAEWAPALPYPPGEQLHCITTENQPFLWVTFSFEATLPLKLPFILRHYVQKASERIKMDTWQEFRHS